MIITEGIGVQIPLQILRADGMIYTIDTPLDVAPETVDGVGMDCPSDILFGRVLDSIVGITQAGKSVIAEHFVGVNHSTRNGGDMLLDNGKQGIRLHIRDHRGDGFPLPFYHTSNDGFTSSPTTPFARALPSNICFIGFNFPKERDFFTGHQLADLGEHPPSRLVGNAQLPLQLLGRNASAGLRHEEDGIEPRAHRSRRMVQNSTRCWREIVVTGATLIDLAARDTIKLAGLFASRAINEFGEPLAAEPF